MSSGEFIYFDLQYPRIEDRYLTCGPSRRILHRNPDNPLSDSAVPGHLSLCNMF